MPGRYAFGPGLLRIWFEGETSLRAVAALLDAALSDPACPPRPVVLNDMRGSTSLGKRSGPEMREAVGLFEARRDLLGNRFAILTSSPLQFGMMRIAGAYSENVGFELEIFEHESPALEWLGVALDPGPLTEGLE